MLAFSLLTNILTSCAPCGLSKATPTTATCVPANNTCNTNTCKFKLTDALLDGSMSKSYSKTIYDCLYACVWSDKCEDLQSRRTISVEYVYCVLKKYLQKVYGTHLDFKYVCLIYKHFKGDITKIIIFLTHVIHNTSGFKYFVGYESCAKGEWNVYSVSRGILQIVGQEYYAIAGYSQDPENLKYLNERSVCASLRVYDYIVQNYACYLCDSWLALKPCEVLNENWKLAAYQQRIANRLTVYTDLIAMFRVKESFTSRYGACFFLRAYREQVKVRCGVVLCGEVTPFGYC